MDEQELTCRVSSPPSRLSALAAAAALLLATASAATAKDCGDTVGGVRVACACGDIVVVDTVLWPTDPVATERCSGDGLTLLADPRAASLTLNLGGQSILGRGYGTGIRVARGGRLGAVIVGGDEDDARAEIANFATGIRASGRDALREVRSIDVHDCSANGLSIHASGVALDDVLSNGNGRDGVALSGHGNRITGVTSSANARDGLKVHGSAGRIDAKTTDNRRNGAVIAGRDNRIEKMVTSGNGAAGVVAPGKAAATDGVQATGNGGSDIKGRTEAGR
ncbi:MAG TPA: hypothetical protein VGK20_04365 [Candidatus Binatia bacterium]|jgi:hypothetical protein